MSRIGKKPIQVPENVEVNVTSNNEITVKGPKGELTRLVDPALTIEHNEGELLVKRPTDNKRHRSIHGLYRSLIANMVEGVTNGFEKRLQIVGVGYRASMQGNNLVLNVGYSHPVKIEPPENVEIEVPKNDQIVVKGPEKEVVGQLAARIRYVRKPEPYKGKGIRYEDEQVAQKVGKSGK